MGRETNVVLTPRLVATDGVTRTMAPEARECFFHGERRLRFYKIYTQKNCRAECLANVTLRACGCVAFHMPRTKKFENIPTFLFHSQNGDKKYVILQEAERHSSAPAAPTYAASWSRQVRARDFSHCLGSRNLTFFFALCDCALARQVRVGRGWRRRAAKVGTLRLSARLHLAHLHRRRLQRRHDERRVRDF